MITEKYGPKSQVRPAVVVWDTSDRLPHGIGNHPGV